MAEKSPIAMKNEFLQMLQRTYTTHVMPLEDKLHYGEVLDPLLPDNYFTAAPVLMVTGLYCSGKTSFIRWLLQGKYDGCDISPQPTTGKFNLLHYGTDPHKLSGNMVASNGRYPTDGVNKKFGDQMCHKFEVTLHNAPLLQYISILDSPCIVNTAAGSSVTSFSEAFDWFASRSTLVLFLLDPEKLDPSIVQTLALLRKFPNKIGFVVNKADLVEVSSYAHVKATLRKYLTAVYLKTTKFHIFFTCLKDIPPGATEIINDMRGLISKIAEMRRLQLIEKLNYLSDRVYGVKKFAKFVEKFQQKLASSEKEVEEGTQAIFLEAILVEYPNYSGNSKFRTKFLEEDWADLKTNRDDLIKLTKLFEPGSLLSTKLKEQMEKSKEHDVIVKLLPKPGQDAGARPSKARGNPFGQSLEEL